MGALVGLIAVGIYLSVTQSTFLTWPNLMNIVKSNSVVLVLAVGATFVIIAAGIDLSAAAATTAAAMVLGLALDAGWPTIPAVIICLLAGCVLGAFNGVLITKLNVSFLVVTLGALAIFQSIALVMRSGQTITVFSKPAFEPINTFANGSVGSVPVLLLFDVFVLLLAGGVLRYTKYGRALFAVGSNAEAARLNGINVKQVTFFVYVIAGLTAGAASIVQVGRLTAASPNIDPTLLLNVLAAVLIGGTAYSGGEGGVLGTLIGVLFLGVVQNGLTLSGVSTFWQGMVSGGILIGAVWIGGLRHRRWRRSTRSRGLSISTSDSPEVAESRLTRN
jgi:ribose/xylose/arabinose/galactoside ABC-type transport system permease subunit